MSKVILLGIDAAVPTLVEEYLELGLMPNLKRVLERGCYSWMTSVFPGVTPVNWATVSTGAYPGTHGITDFFVQDPGDHLDTARVGFQSSELKAETLWQAAERKGLKTATIDFPQSWPPDGRTGICVAADGTPAAASFCQLRLGTCFVSASVSGVRHAAVIDLRREGRERVGEFTLPPDTDPKGIGPTHRVRLSEDGPVCYVSGINGQEVALRPGDWSPWCDATFVEHGRRVQGPYRFLLSRLSADLDQFMLYCSPVMCLDRVAVPTQVGHELVDKLGPYQWYCGNRAYDRGWYGLEALLAEGEYNGHWVARAGRVLLDDYGVDLLMIKWHFLDHIEHLIWGYIDPVSPWYDPEKRDYYEAAMRRAYQIADEMVGYYLPHLDEGAHVTVVSDHGHIAHTRALSVNNFLASRGLIQWQPGERRPVIDWSRTLAYAGPAHGQIRINLVGREPQGIVPPSDYEALRNQIIEMLLSYRDPSSGERPFTVVVRREEAQFLGLWGPRTGDIVFLAKEGWTADAQWFPITADGQISVPMSPHQHVPDEYGDYRFIASKFQSTHGCSMPTARYGRGTEQSFWACAGPGLRKGYRRERPLSMVEVAPTISFVAGLPTPAQCEGNVARDFLKPEH